MVIFDLANFPIVMVRISITFLVALSLALAGFSQGNGVDTQILAKPISKGLLPQLPSEAKWLQLEAYPLASDDSASTVTLDRSGRLDQRAQIPNSYEGDNCVAMPNAHMGDNCVPMPNVYHNERRPATVIRRPSDYKVPHFADSTGQELRKYFPDATIQQFFKERERKSQDRHERK